MLFIFYSLYMCTKHTQTLRKDEKITEANMSAATQFIPMIL